ncbi:MAG TPA: glutamine-hydrolyzing carbamoyl-phosphate synthase small subunit [Bacteroidota bacterium]|nr:glutamine-hydrolyzing carbamoyl-phosphate synthase small subunit [Bacteroidota bacterium]
MKAEIVFQDGFRCEGEHFGAPVSIAGEVVFNTGMVGYPEAMTDPSYAGQILVLTYPLIGNYGIPVNGDGRDSATESSLSPFFESGKIHIRALVISRLSDHYSHWSARSSLESWMMANNVPGVSGVDTRALTKHLRTQGCLLGKILVRNEDVAWDDPNDRNIVAEVSTPQVELLPGRGAGKVVLVDMGSKDNIARSLLNRGLSVLKVPWDYDWTNEDVDGVVISNGPGDPKKCGKSIEVIRKGFDRGFPIFGICLGHQLIALAAGADTYKLKFGHRGQNQPCIEVGSKRCFITSQNHGFAVDEKSLPTDWLPWFFNANDGTNEGIRHRSRPISSVQFHPEARPGPSDTDHLFDHFVQSLHHAILSS